MKNASEYKTRVGSSYQCIAVQALNFTNGTGKNILGFQTYTLQVQAYHSKNNTEFDNREYYNFYFHFI